MFRKFIFVLFLVFMLSLVSEVPAQDVAIPSPGVMPKLDGNIDEVWYFSEEHPIDTSQVGAAPSSTEPEAFAAVLGRIVSDDRPATAHPGQARSLARDQAQVEIGFAAPARLDHDVTGDAPLPAW